jgi:sodium/bile acid cotransporter 7
LSYRTTFSGAFKTGALFLLPPGSVIFNVFINIATYMIFTVACFFIARPPPTIMRAINRNVADSKFGQRLPNILRRMVTVKQTSKEQTIAVCLCGAAKTTSLGIPLVSAMWKPADDLTRAYVQIPVLLYTIEQVFLAQILVYVFRWYLRRDKERVDDREENAAATGNEAESAEKETRPETSENLTTKIDEDRNV